MNEYTSKLLTNVPVVEGTPNILTPTQKLQLTVDASMIMQRLVFMLMLTAPKTPEMCALLNDLKDINTKLGTTDHGFDRARQCSKQK